MEASESDVEQYNAAILSDLQSAIASVPSCPARQLRSWLMTTWHLPLKAMTDSPLTLALQLCNKRLFRLHCPLVWFAGSQDFWRIGSFVFGLVKRSAPLGKFVTGAITLLRN